MQNTKSIALISLGCAKNLVNSEQMLALLAQAGYTLTPDADGADAAVVNTCGFIDAAKQEAIDTIIGLGTLKKSGKLGKIIVAGCLAERYRDEILGELPEVDAVVTVGAFGDIVAAVEHAFSGDARVFSGDAESVDDDAPRLVSTPQSWAYLKIADGCDNRCAYCVIPSIRGRYRSRKIESIVAEAQVLAENGVRELILIAQDTTRYGLDIYGQRRLRELLRRLGEIENLRWIRVHYMYPDEIDGALLDEFAENAKLLPYFDIPIQHIDDGILRLMNRRGTSAEIRALIADIRARVPGSVIRTSLITGLPGETDEAFTRLCDFLRETQIERPGIFAFSPEEGTPAFDMEYPDEETAQKRLQTLELIQSDALYAFNRSRIGTRVTVLIEDYEDGRYLARSYAESPDVDGYLYVTSDKPLETGVFYEVTITGEDGSAQL